MHSPSNCGQRKLKYDIVFCRRKDINLAKLDLENVHSIIISSYVPRLLDNQKQNIYIFFINYKKSTALQRC